MRIVIPFLEIWLVVIFIIFAAQWLKELRRRNLYRRTQETRECQTFLESLDALSARPYSDDPGQDTGGGKHGERR
jgi:hypothetical protein